MQGAAPTRELRAGRRALEGIEGVELAEDWRWDEDHERWVLHLRLRPGIEGSERVPACTDWYVLADPSYPWGSVKFYPARDGGIERTFWHQSYNGPGPTGRAWRDGAPCLDTSVRVLGRHGFDDEPREAHARLRWHTLRALDWLRAADEERLVLPGDPYELPEFPRYEELDVLVAFSEGATSFDWWRECTGRSGTVSFYSLRESPELLVVKEFRSLAGRPIIASDWGRCVRGASEVEFRGIWLRLDGPPVLLPWQAAATWGELRHACRSQGLELDNLMRPLLPGMRDGERHVALVGFPIPERFGDGPGRIHWQAMRLPALQGGRQVPDGFRPNEMGYRERDRRTVFAGTEPLRWLRSENWSEDQLATRGRLPEEVRGKSVLLVGAGALGSPLGEMLVRGGVHRLTVVDGQTLQAGNLVRHTLGLDRVGKLKADSTSQRLNLASPHASVVAINTRFPPDGEVDGAQARGCDVVLDCTAEDELLHELEVFEWGEPKHFVSLSLGMGARRLYCFSAEGLGFPYAAFRALIDPWLRQEAEEYEGSELPREGVGCWHPVFPARVDDVWLMAGVAVKYLEGALTSPSVEPRLAVYERHDDEEGNFAGVRRVDPGG